MCAPCAGDYRIEKQNPARTFAAGRSEAAAAGYHQGQNSSGMGAEDRSRNRPAAVTRVFPKSGSRRAGPGVVLSPSRNLSDANIFFGNLASDQLLHLFTLLGSLQGELDSHAEARMSHLHHALHAQLHRNSTDDDVDGSTRRKRLRRFHVAAAGADVAKHTAIRYGASLAENICSETAGMARLHAPIRG